MKSFVVKCFGLLTYNEEPASETAAQDIAKSVKIPLKIPTVILFVIKIILSVKHIFLSIAHLFSLPKSDLMVLPGSVVFLLYFFTRS